MSKIFLNIPDDFENIITSYVPERFNNVYRLITHKGTLLPIDFYPTFVDTAQLERIEKAKTKGGPASVVASQVNNGIQDYSVSLIPDIIVARKALKKRSKVFSAIACGYTDDSKGVAHQDNSSHISYYLYDYIVLNPYEDFSEEECIQDE